MRFFARHLKIHTAWLLRTAAAALLVASSAPAGSFFSDFNSALPLGTAVYTNTVWSATGGYTNSGCIKLTTATASQNGAFIITNDLDSGTPVVSFTANFKMLIGGGSAADGVSFNFAPDLPLNAITEEGAGTGLTVEFDTFQNVAPDTIGIDVKGGGNEVSPNAVPLASIRANAFVDVFIQWAPDGTVQVFYDGIYAHTNDANIGNSPITAGLFGFGARTGGQDDNQFIDNLQIVTRTNPMPLATYFAPIGRSVRGDSPIHITLTDYGAPVDTTKITLQLDGSPVTPAVTYSAPTTTISYTNPALFASGSSHTVSLVYADTASPTPNTNTLNYGFTVATYAALPTNLVANPSLVSANKGFDLRISQIDAHLGNTIARAENQLANLLIDPNTSLPYLNQATTPSTNEGYVINYSKAGGQGDFPTEPANSIPGLPGTTGGDTNAAMEVVTYLNLTAGQLYTLGVNSSDGFRLTAASIPDAFALEESKVDGVRAAADTTVSFSVVQSGYYPFRLLYFVGGIEAVNPTADNPSLEFFSEDSSGNRTLINDTNQAIYVPAFRAAQTLPYIRSVNPAIGQTGVPRGSSIDATLVDGTITVQTNTIQLLLDGAVVSPVINSNSGITTVHFQPVSLFNPNTTHTNQLAFTDSNSTRRTNTWSFSVENILSQLWVIPPNSSTNATWAKWVTSGSTERGLAYNPKTGHVLLVSRAGSAGIDGANGGGIGIFGGNDGHYISKLNVQLPDTTYITNGPGTFKLSLVDVADDGVIYVCNLCGGTTSALRIYRWQDENSQPTVAFAIAGIDPSIVALGGRVGDDFVVRGSGAGTQIIMSGNSQNAPGPVNTVAMFTSVDATNFALTVLGPITGLPNNVVRLGLAFGCGNTFYGETTGGGNPVRYSSFNGPPSSVASLTASYTCLDFGTNATFGPIGVDIPNQRLIADATSQVTGSAHSMNLFDLNTLATTGNNLPIDHKTFATSSGSFGTGAVDFSPDGTRVYTLDTANGIIAFSLAPKVASLSICAQPRTFLVPTLGGVGFMDVMSIGSPQKFQWRFHGTSPTGTAASINNATNRTLDTYGVQLSQLGFYSVVITNPLGLGSVTSSVAYLDTQMVITNQPADQVIAPGSTASFTVGVSNGLPAYSYQWTAITNGVTNIISTASSLAIPNAQAANGGAYFVTITDVLGQSISSQLALLTVGTPGTGTGLAGDYYDLLTYATATPPDPFDGPPFASQIDPTINFNFGTGNIGPGNADYVDVRWHGQVQPFYSQTYTFYTTSDDGSRLWVNGQLVVNNWNAQPPTEKSGTITLTANQKYDLLMEYFEKTGGAVAQLSWSSPSQFKQIIPMTQLYPTPGPFFPTLSSGLVNGTNLVLNWTGSCILYSATNVTGPWAPIATNISPFTINVNSGPQMFFRLLSQQSF